MLRTLQKGYAAVELIVVAALVVGLGISLHAFNNFSGDTRVGASEETKVAVLVPVGSGDISNEDGNSVTNRGDMWLGNGQSRDNSYLGIIFSGDAVPQGAKVTKAELKFVQPKDAWIAIAFRAGVEDSQNPASFSSSNKISTRTLLPVAKDFQDNVEWKAKQTYSYDVTPVIQAYTAKYQSNKIAMILKGTGGSWGRKFVYSGGEKPRLEIQYTVSATDTQGGTATTTPSPIPTIVASPTPVPATPTPTKTATPRPTRTATPRPTSAPTVAPTMVPNPTPSTGGNQGGGNAENSHALGLWTPTSRDTCSKEIHDSYSVVVEGKRYPTWHPPVDPATGCTFGHEHGRDPSASDLMPFIREHYGSTGIPFGLANEKLDEWNAANGIDNGMRHEDHVGHKIEWENNVELRRNNCANTPASPGCFNMTNIGVQCDFLMKVHQGTHSKDAFTNNMHELEYFVDCTDGTRIAATKMVLFGNPGEFTSSNKSTVIKVGAATPPNSMRSNGVRFIPTIDGVREHILVPPGSWSMFSNGLYEDWLSSNYIYSANGRLLAYYDPHFAVFGPSRFYDPSKPDNVGRSIDVCYMTELLGLERARGGECDGVPAGLSYDDPRSPFNGVKREFYFNQTSINNAGGPTIWYTDPFGRAGRNTPFPGSIKQYIAPINNEKGFAVESIAIGANRYYGGRGVHAPN